MPILNFYDASKSYTAIVLQVFSNLQIYINGSDLYTIPIVFSNASRLKKKLSRTQNKEFNYRTPIMSLETNITSEGLDRSTNRLLKRRVIENGGNNISVTWNDTPTNFQFSLTVIADTLTTLMNIVEGIKGLFHNNVTYKDYISPLGYTIRTPIKIESISVNIENEESVYEGDRILEAEFDIILEGVVHSQFNTSNKKISEIQLLLNDYSNSLDNTIETYLVN